MKSVRTVSFTTFLLSVFSSSCVADQNTHSANAVQERVAHTGEDDWKDTTLVNRLLSENQAIRVNAETNYATYYEGGQPVSKWKVATGRLGAETPKGVFRIHKKDHCPDWDNGRGNSAAGCTDSNPLGERAVWFYEGYLYGLHGVNDAGLYSVTSDDPRERDASGGCVRNHPSNIAFVFDTVHRDTPVIIGLWDQDPDVKDCSGNGAACGNDGLHSYTNTPATPSGCFISVGPDTFATLRSHAEISDGNIIGSLSYGHEVTVLQSRAGDTVDGSETWHEISTETEDGPQTGYVHSSLIWCDQE